MSVVLKDNDISVPVISDFFLQQLQIIIVIHEHSNAILGCAWRLRNSLHLFNTFMNADKLWVKPAAENTAA